MRCFGVAMLDLARPMRYQASLGELDDRSSEGTVRYMWRGVHVDVYKGLVTEMYVYMHLSVFCEMPRQKAWHGMACWKNGEAYVYKLCIEYPSLYCSLFM